PAPRAAVRLRRRIFAQSFETGPALLAEIGLPVRNRRRSSAKASADLYRRLPSFSRAFRQITSRSAATEDDSLRGGTGSSEMIFRIRATGVSARKGSKSVRIS